MRITLVDGSLGGAGGNTAAVLAPLIEALRAQADVEAIHLATDPRPLDAVEALLRASDGFVFATGTYWDSWGSPLQAFLERATGLEAGPAWLGKPAAVVVTMHSVGGKGVLSRLQGVLSTLGLLLPPMTGFAYSLAGHLALDHAPHADFWHRDDLAVVAHNLLEAVRGGRDWRAWPVDAGDPRRRWIDP
jgi:multimeric flavodoxin WrbA